MIVGEEKTVSLNLIRSFEATLFAAAIAPRRVQSFAAAVQAETFASSVRSTINTAARAVSAAFRKTNTPNIKTSENFREFRRRRILSA